MIKPEQYLYAIETLNLNNKKIINSREFATGIKILNAEKLLKRKAFFSSIPRFFRNKKVVNNYLNGSEENMSYQEWLSLLRFGDNAIKIAVYSCILGDYDSPKSPLLKFDNIDYVLFTDKKCGTENGWMYKEIPEALKSMSKTKINRYIKMHPFEFFEADYDYAIYLDGNVQTISDISVFAELVDSTIGIAAHLHRFRDCIYDEERVCLLKNKGNKSNLLSQIKKYRGEGFPTHYGLIECTVLVTDLKNMFAKKIYSDWWNEFLSTNSNRDQISFPYILWKNGVSIKRVGTLGKNLYMNSKIRVFDHQ